MKESIFLEEGMVESTAFQHIATLNLIALGNHEDVSKRLLKEARKIQRASNCKVTRKCMEIVCQSNQNRVKVVRDAYDDLIKSGEFKDDVGNQQKEGEEGYTLQRL